MLLAALASVVIASYYDGDTCTNTTGEKIRLACIDTPEMKASLRHRTMSVQASEYDNTRDIQEKDNLKQFVLAIKVSI